jgi:membrane fusion protein (multidrug efflux system)
MSQVADVDVEQSVKADVPKVEVGAASSHKSNRMRWILSLALGAVVAGGVYWWLESQGFESTDDAQIEGHLDVIAPRISGTVTYINPKVANNQMVEAGALLLELDPHDYQAELDHAKANLDAVSAEARAAQVNVPIVAATAFSELRSAEAAKLQAAAGVSGAEAKLVSAQHKLQQDEAEAERAEKDRVRYQALVEKHEISRSDYDVRATEAFHAQQAVESDRAEIKASEDLVVEAKSLVNQRAAQIDGAQIAPQRVTDAKARSAAQAGQSERAAADVNTAQLNLGYTKIYAPVTGVIGRKTVELGQRVQPGQGLMVVVPLDDIWITANFKETQLRKMRPGQSVEIYVDTFGRKLKGTVESMPGAAGPLFSLFPPENSSGNYVKVVQRFPVRIRFGQDQDPQHILRPGMSVEPTVTVQ